MQHALEALTAQALAHPTWFLAAVLLVAFTESLAIVGTFVPAAIAMFVAGATAGHGAASVGLVLLAAGCGAVAGDALSYELGRGREPQFRGTALFQRHEAAVRKAQEFLARHGAASIVLARFTGAVRAFVPLLAGFSRMNRWRFYTVNVLSAALWAPAHILPGVVFGASLQLAEAVTGRLALLLALLLVVLWSAIWIATRALSWLIPLVGRARAWLAHRVRQRSGPVARIALDVLDPERPGSHALLTGAVVLLGCTWLFFGIVEDVLTRDPLVQTDQSIYAFFQGMRVAPVDRVVVGITEMGSVGVMLPLSAMVLAWLVWHGCRRTALYWIASVAFAELLVQTLKFTLGRHRPLALYTGNEAFSFPSGHTTVSTVVLGLLAFLLSRGQRRSWRVAVAALAATYVALVAMSRLYLGAHWFSDVAGGMSFGLAWIALVAMVYTHRGTHEDLRPRSLAGACLATIVVCGAAWMNLRGPVDRAMYATAPPPPATMTSAAWRSGGWRSLPQYRHDVAGESEEQLPLQWACSEQGLRDALARSGWHAAAGWNLANALRLFAPGTPLTDLPVLPRWDAGRRSLIAMVRSVEGEADTRLVMRLWRSDGEVVTPRGPVLALWYGTAYRERQRTGPLPLLAQKPVDVAAIEPLLPPMRTGFVPKADGGSPPILLSCAAAG